jgi:hypothetical protein
MGIEAKVIEDSVYFNKEENKFQRLTTMQLKYHRYVHSEVMTHRVFSRNASSSRAIPVATMLKQVWNDPAMPVHWGQNQAGMQAKAELDGIHYYMAEKLWRGAAKVACIIAYGMNKVGLHKQIANRILEPWQFIHVILSSTEWDNFYALRDHPDAQPEIAELARKMSIAQTFSNPRFLDEGKWHLPYTLRNERDTYDIETLKKISTARCARVSYLTHDGKTPNVENDIKLHDRLVGSVPIHASPTEHVATPSFKAGFSKNFSGYTQYREEVESQILKAR